MSSAFRKPERFEEEFSEHHGKTLKPLNFTEDWLKEKSRSKRRGVGRFEEDDDDDDMEEESESQGSEGEGGGVSSFVMQEFDPPAEERSVEKKINVDVPPAYDQVSPLEGVRQRSGSIVDADLSRFASMHPTEQNLDEHRPHQQNPLIAEHENTQAAREPIVHYEQYAKPEIITPEQRAEAIDDARKVGYLEGFRQGEIKGNVKAQEDAQIIFSKLSAILDEVQGLKMQVLENAQDIFIDVCEAIAEAVVRKEFKLNPASFGAMIRQVVKESVPGDSFEIKLDQQMYEILQNAGLGDLASRIKCDSSLAEPGDFRIESNLTAVDGNLRRMVKEMMDRAGIELFDELKNVS